MRTRCPRCQTIFRITPEQLRARAGKVRCGHCQAVFNALETLVEETPATEPPAAPPTQEPLPPAAPPPEPAPVPEALPEPEPASRPEEPELRAESHIEPGTEPEETGDATSIPEEPFRDETPEETTLAAREAGLVAARELAETPGYNRWAAGTLASSPLAGLDSDHPRTRWPFILASVLLAIGLLAQIAYHFRTGLSQRLPMLDALFAALDVDVPLPRQVDMVSIETSDLQSDNTRGFLVLQATLKNRAPYPQAWPDLELTLTDAHDTVVARRVLDARDYLPPKADSRSFPANSEIGLRLWIEAKEIAAAGYRLYVFYP